MEGKYLVCIILQGIPINYCSNKSLHLFTQNLTDISMSRFLSKNNKIWNAKVRKLIVKVKYFFIANCVQ